MLCFATAPILATIPEQLSWTPPEALSPTESTAASSTMPELEPIEPQTRPALNPALSGCPDGSYTGVGIGFGGEIKLVVTVEQGRIVAIEIRSAPGETEPFFTRAKQVIEAILSAQSWEVDAISGATYSARGISAAVQNALTGQTPPQSALPASPAPKTSQAFTERPFNPPSGGYLDGVYSGSAQGFGGLITVQVTISDGRIAELTVLEASGETPSYFASASSVLSSILQAQSPNVDAISGATYSSRGLIHAVKNALQKAGKQSPAKNTAEDAAPAPEAPELTTPESGSSAAPNYAYPDGKYRGAGNGFGGQILVELSIEHGQIQSIALLEAANETPVFLEKAAAVIDRILAAQSVEVDAVSGATLSSNGIIEAVANALAAANAASQNPVPTTPSPSEPAPTEPDPTEPAPTEPDPTEPDPTEPDPTEPDPTEPDPTEPDPTEPDPTEPDPQNPETPALPITTISTETYVGRATVAADEDEAFFDYDITLTVTVAVTQTSSEVDGKREIVTERTVTELSIHADTDATNLAFLNQALHQMKPQLMAGTDEIDAVSGASCSSRGIREAWKQAMKDVVLGKTVEIEDEAP